MNEPEQCSSCHDSTVHRAIDEHGSQPMCGLCLLVLIGALTRSGVPVTLVADAVLSLPGRP